MSCGVGRRGSSDPALLWLWWRPAATAPIRPLVWEPQSLESLIHLGYSKAFDKLCDRSGDKDQTQMLFTACFILHFIDCTSQVLHCSQIEGLGESWIVQAYWCHFSKSICSLCVAVSHFGNSHGMSNVFIIIIFGEVHCDLWCYYCFEALWTPPTYDGELNGLVCAVIVPLTSCSPVSVPLFLHLYSLRHNNIEIRPINNSTMASNVQVKRRITWLTF